MVSSVIQYDNGLLKKDEQKMLFSSSPFKGQIRAEVFTCTAEVEQSGFLFSVYLLDFFQTMFLVRFKRSVIWVQQDLSRCALSIGCHNVAANRTWKESYVLLLLSFVSGHINLLSDAEVSFHWCHLGVLLWKSKLESLFNKNSIEDPIPSCISTLTSKTRDKTTCLGILDVGKSFSEVVFLLILRLLRFLLRVSSFSPQFWWKQIVLSVLHRTSNVFLLLSLCKIKRNWVHLTPLQLFEDGKSQWSSVFPLFIGPVSRGIVSLLFRGFSAVRYRCWGILWKSFHGDWLLWSSAIKLCFSLEPVLRLNCRHSSVNRSWKRNGIGWGESKWLLSVRET